MPRHLIPIHRGHMISASFKNGVLKVIIPRPTDLKPNVHKIQIQK